MTKSTLLLFLILVLLVPHCAVAHPHVFATYEVQVVESDGKLDKIHFVFYPKSFFSSVVSVTSMIDGDPNSSVTTTHIYHEDYAETFRLSPVAVYISYNGAADEAIPVKLRLVKEDEKSPVYEFDMPIPEDTQSLAFSLYDPSAYVSAVMKGDVQLSPSSDLFSCKATNQEVGNPVWGEIMTRFVVCKKDGDLGLFNFVPHPMAFNHPLYKSP
jgi:ABC-type uncharacterized transport system substrate-binding protein